MLEKHVQIVSCVFLSFAVLVPCSGDANHEKTNESSTLKNIGEAYLNALEKFDRSNASLIALTSAIKPFLKLLPNPGNYQFVRGNELGAFLYTFAKLRPDTFTDVQGSRMFTSDEIRCTLHASIRRNDGTLFLFSIGSNVNAALIYMKDYKLNKDGKRYRWIKGEVRHTVGVDLTWKEEDKQLKLSANYLCDVFKYSQAVRVTV